MTFVNQIAEIIHGVVDEFHGVPPASVLASMAWGDARASVVTIFCASRQTRTVASSSW